MCVCSCPLSRLSCILYCNSFLSLMREDWRDTNWTYVNLNSACLCSHTLWPISFSKNALVDLSAYIFWLVSQNVLQEGLSCCWSFFFLILRRKTEPAVHKHIHLSPWLDKELKRWIGEGETCSIKFILSSQFGTTPDFFHSFDFSWATACLVGCDLWKKTWAFSWQSM